MSPFLLYSLLFILTCFGIIYPPVEAISAGLTIQTIFGSFLGSEAEQFITYHIKRVQLTIIIYSLMPLSYILGLYLFNANEEVEYLTDLFTRQVFTAISIILPVYVWFHTINWTKDNYKKHPIVKNILKFSNNNSDWKSVATDIDNEFRRIDKINIQTNPICKVIATENWILKAGLVTVDVAHQSDASLEVVRSDTHQISHNDSGEVQYINILVKSSRSGVKPFNIRLNARDFKDLEDRVARRITVLPTVQFHKTLVDRFIDSFKEVVEHNSKFVTNQQLDNCIGCMQSVSNVKLQKLCAEEGNNNCSNCYCRPMWCIDCMARWFASRQDGEEPSSWLSAKCTCPVCRAQFCMLDVCYVDQH